MINKIKNRIDNLLPKFLKDLNRSYSLSRISPLLFSSIMDFATREGKRIRPILFIIGYLGFAKKEAPNLYESALSLELLHDFMLVHDDIIDKSDFRRSKPSMHKLLGDSLKKHKNIKFNGQDLAIIIGDVMYAMALHAFLSIKEKPKNKEAAFKKLLETALYTGSGEFIELLAGMKPIGLISKNEIYRIYDLKTANYTFASPLAIGATLAGADKKEVDRLFKFGSQLGRAFQVKDDLLGMFGSENKIGKSILSDLQESKKTILIWQAFHYSNAKNKNKIREILNKKRIFKADLLIMRKILKEAKVLEFSKTEISNLVKNAQKLLAHSKIKPKFKSFLYEYNQKILAV